jgi:hypothetical protein
MKLVINQSNYIPWKGYFDLIRAADHFIIYDTAQYTKNDWRNRNQIKTPEGLKWMTIPVKRNFGQAIRKTVVQPGTWARKHWEMIKCNYSRAPYFADYREEIAGLYEWAAEVEYLSSINHRFIRAICAILGITTKITWSHEYLMAGGKTERLLGLCRSVGADEYISGPAAIAYLDQEAFHQAGIKVTWANYAGYPEYGQMFGPFENCVSVLDLIFNAGPQAANFLKDIRSGEDNG